MDTLTLRQLLLVMHLSGLALMAGTTASEFVALRAFINLFKTNGEISAGLLKLMSDLAVILTVGGVLLVLSGIGLTAITGGVFLHQLWLKLKLALIVLLPLNGMLVGGPQMKKLRNSFSEKGAEMTPVIKSAVSKLNRFHAVQLFIFLAIIILAVFKFN